MTEKQPQARGAAAPKEIYHVICHTTNARTKSAVLKELILKEYRKEHGGTV